MKRGWVPKEYAAEEKCPDATYHGCMGSRRTACDSGRRVAYLGQPGSSRGGDQRGPHGVQRGGLAVSRRHRGHRIGQHRPRRERTVEAQASVWIRVQRYGKQPPSWNPNLVGHHGGDPAPCSRTGFCNMALGLGGYQERKSRSPMFRFGLPRHRPTCGLCQRQSLNRDRFGQIPRLVYIYHEGYFRPSRVTFAPKMSFRLASGV